ncbi:MAG: hypothetical protein RDV48_26045 [Candidatus Eremiobacteraeota bacterium]|nr:hypothetical protein [Candidatus Eremiobacteraeota bacterium]
MALIEKKNKNKRYFSMPWKTCNKIHLNYTGVKLEALIPYGLTGYFLLREKEESP